MLLELLYGLHILHNYLNDHVTKPKYITGRTGYFNYRPTPTPLCVGGWWVVVTNSIPNCRLISDFSSKLARSRNKIKIFT